MSGKDLFDKVAASISADHPSFEIRYKNESWLMRLLALLMFPFNPNFATEFTTTLGSKTYLPSRDEVAKDYEGYAGTLAHEGVHVFDDSRRPLWFKLSYSLNQSLVLPLLVLFAVFGSWIPVAALVGGVTLAYISFWLLKNKPFFFAWAGLGVVSYIGLSIWLSGWWTALALGSFLPLIPVTSYWRAKWEYRGYAMTMAFDFWVSGKLTDGEVTWIDQIFTGPAYYYMDTSADRVADKLKDIKASILNGSLLVGADARPYQRTHDLLKQMSILKGGISA